ncbi:hypothetical protein EJ06DRAFT_490740 [Trichodelitschia bisporula]|uniref:Kinetochore protein mis14 n=1 Tax=Trichodelitschia bisporula TaxID=703511 RepID=A0A6G1I2F0_9PEZI|nr:hypothetical protein EJ06DRAFT_490740 [Trichodelitschia bisporula]
MSSPTPRASELRKIELQSLADLRHLHATALRAALAKLDAAFPPSAAAADAPTGSADDALRARVQELIEGYVRATFEAVRANVWVNGVDVPAGVTLDEGLAAEVEEEFEPLDTNLASRIRALEATKETLTEKVADLRRGAPAKAASDFKARWEEEEKAFEAWFEERRAEEERAAAQGEDDVRLERWDEVRATWERGTEGLVALKGGLTETVARLERAKAVVEHLDGK